MIRFCISIAIFLSALLSAEEIVKGPLKDKATNQFLKMMLTSYWKKVSLPYERLDDIFDLLEKYGDDGELAMILLHEKYPDMADPSSSFSVNYKKARAKKFQSYAKSLLPHIKEGVLLDFGAGDTQLALSLVGLHPDITQAYATDIFPFTPNTTHPKVSFLQQKAPDATPFTGESVDTVILSTVLHHITPEVRRSLLTHLYSILNPGGRVILVEDSFPSIPPMGRNDIETAFFSLFPAQRRDVLCFLDWWGNRLMKNRSEIPLPCTFKTMEEWVALFKDFGFKVIKDDFDGFPPIYTHMVSPKAVLVFEKPEIEPSTRCLRNHVKRAEKTQTVMGILPNEGVKINISIGGTKILVNAVDSTGTILYASTSYQWRTFSNSAASIQEKRSWMIDQIIRTIQDAKNQLLSSPIEGIGLSWAGPISKNERVIGPNIMGFGFEDLNEKEKIEGGVDIKSLLCEKLPEKWRIRILNDADEEAVSEFSAKGESEGTLLILGTGVGAGFFYDNAPFYGPDSFIGRMGEIGHHIVFNKEKNSYEYYGLESRGEILPVKYNRFTDRLSAPSVARRFLNLVMRELNHDSEKVFTYLNSREKLFSLSEIQNFFEKNECSCSLEERVLTSITDKAQKQDDRAKRYIHAIGFEIGSAFRSFAQHFSQFSCLKQIHLAGSLGRLFAKDVYSARRKELFLEAIELGIAKD